MMDNGRVRFVEGDGTVRLRKHYSGEILKCFLMEFLIYFKTEYMVILYAFFKRNSILNANFVFKTEFFFENFI